MVTLQPLLYLSCMSISPRCTPYPQITIMYVHVGALTSMYAYMTDLETSLLHVKDPTLSVIA